MLHYINLYGVIVYLFTNISSALYTLDDLRQCLVCYQKALSKSVFKLL